MTEIKICGITNKEDALFAAACGADALGFIFHPPSPRCISPEKAKMIIDALPREVVKVGVFVNRDVDEVERIRHFCGLDLIQLHGDETPDYCRAFPPSIIIKAISSKRQRRICPLTLSLDETYGPSPLTGEDKGEGENLIHQPAPSCLPQQVGEGKWKKAIIALPPGEGKSLGSGIEQGMEALLDYDVRAIIVDSRDNGRYGGTGLTCDWELAGKVKRMYPLVLSGGLKEENIAEALTRVSPQAVDINSGIESAPGRKDHRKLGNIIEIIRSLSGSEDKKKIFVPIYETHMTAPVTKEDEITPPPFPSLKGRG